MPILILLSLAIFIIEAVVFLGLAFLTTVLIITSILDLVADLKGATQKEVDYEDCRNED